VAAADADEADAGELRDLLRERVSLRSSRSISDMLVEVTASVRTGASAGLTLA
jgi:hypothetical protein